VLFRSNIKNKKMEEITINDNDISLNLVCNVPVIKKSANRKRQQTKRISSKPADEADIGAIDDNSSSVAAPQQVFNATDTLQPSSVRIQAPVVKSKDMDTFRPTPTTSGSSLVSTSNNNNKNNIAVEQEERAKYMAQYHARPLEMDRRANAMLHIRPSHSSTRIFEKDTTFEQLGVNPRFVPALTRMSFHQPTSIQRDAIPKLLVSSTNNNSSSSFCIQCETGSGKTIAYILPILQSIVNSLEEEKKRSSSRTDMGTRAIIICPTRELATQTFRFTSNLLQHSYPYIVSGCLSGGEKRKSEKAKLRKGITILFATPGRLLDHFTKTECFTSSVKKGPLSWFVLDEVDRLLDMGLKGQIQEIVQRLCGIYKSLSPNWKSILVSATFPPAVLTLAKSILGDEKEGQTMQWSTPIGQDSNTTTTHTGQILMKKDQDYSHAAPHQLSQLYMVVSSKLRLAALTSFLVARVKKGHSVIVFLSTCDSVDFHYALFTKMKPIVSTTSAAGKTNNGIFGTPLLKLHGNINPSERQQVLQKLCSTTTSSYILFATDVAARGLNLGNQLDWIVQYDAPCEVTDYVHRVGRSARAGNAGHAILFLLPTEQEYVTVLKSHGLGENITALSLSATLQTAAKLCPTVLLDDINNSGDVDVDGSTGQHTNVKDSKRNRSGEAFAAGILRRFEECVLQDSKSAQKDSTSKRADNSDPKEDNLLSLARQAFRSYIRAYPTKEKSVRHIFSSRALHLGHVARSFALKESPIAVNKTIAKKSGAKNNKKRDNSHFAFDNISSKKQMKLVLRNDDKKMEGTDKATSAKQLRQNKAAMISAAWQSEKELGEFG